MTTTEQYLGWIEEVAPKHLEAARKMVVEAEERVAAEFTGTCWYSEPMLDALWGDIWGMVRYGHRPYLVERRIEKRRRAAAKAAETRRRTRERYGPGRDRWGEPVDSQRSKVYKAERRAFLPFESAFGANDMRRWKTVGEMQSYVDRLLASAWWKRRWPTVTKIVVKDGRGRRKAGSAGGSILMPLWARKEWVILHEIAHEVVGRTIGHRNVAAHGREFCQVYLELVGHMMGDDARKALKDEFQAHKVKHTKARKPMSEEQRAAAAERLTAARSRKEG